MNLHDPKRPTIGHRPALINGTIVVPQLCIWPEPDGKLQVGVMLDGRWHHIKIFPDQFPLLTHDYRSDPEYALQSWFSYVLTQAPKREAASAPAYNINDLI